MVFKLELIKQDLYNLLVEEDQEIMNELIELVEEELDINGGINFFKNIENKLINDKIILNIDDIKNEEIINEIIILLKKRIKN